MGRSRSRERSRERSRSSRRDRSRSRSRDRRDRDRDRDRDRRSPPRRSRTPPRTAAPSIPPIVPAFTDVSSIQAMAALQQQQQLQRQLLQQQMLLQTQTAGNSSHQERLARKQREIYVGNLAVGVVNMDMLRELFNAVLAQMVPDPVTTPPVVDVRVDPSGRFGFVELRTHELSDAAIQLDKLEVCGRKLNVARPKDYVDVRTQMAPAAKISAAQMFAASLSAAGVAVPGAAGVAAGLPPAPAAFPAGVAGLPVGLTLPGAPSVATAAAAVPGGATTVVMLENLLHAGRVRNEHERRELYEDVLGEASVCGAVLGIAIPIPPLSVGETEACRVYIRYGNPLDSQKCMRRMDGRSFEENKVKATYVSELDFGRAQAGEWIVQHSAAAVPGLPAGYPGSALPGPPLVR